MTHTPSLEAFLSEPYNPAEDDEPAAVGPTAQQPTIYRAAAPPAESAAAPLASIAESLQQLVVAVQASDAEESEADRLREAFDDLEAKHEALLGLLEQVEQLVKPSTSKLANSVRDAIATWKNPEVPAEPAEDEPATQAEGPGPELRQPARDADVTDWRTYARQLGHGRTGPASNELEQMNRSQIRTLLGIDQTAE